MSDNAKRPDVYSELFPNRFLKADKFKGKKPTLTITDVIVEELPDEKKGKSLKGILLFKETPFQLTINKTNGQCLRAMFGVKIPDWRGKRVTFQSEIDNMGAEKVDAIRIQGSPDIERDIEVTIKIPKKAPKKRRLIKTGKGAVDQSMETGSTDSAGTVVNQETGEVTEKGDAYEGPDASGNVKEEHK